MNYEETLKMEMEMHSEVYSSEEDFLHNAFFPPLNGFIWVDGELVNLATNGLKEQKFSNYVVSDAGVLHPPGQGSAAMRIPVNAKDDWVEATQKAIDFAWTLKSSTSDKILLLTMAFLIQNSRCRSRGEKYEMD